MKTCLSNRGCFTSRDEIDEKDCGDGRGAVRVRD